MKNSKAKEVIYYLIFGILTTVVNISVYGLCRRALILQVASSNVIAWFCSVFFAYVTNRKWVFGSEAKEVEAVFKECCNFFIGRIATGVFDTLFMIITVNLIHMEDFGMKIISNIIIVILNYLVSKLLVFKKGV